MLASASIIDVVAETLRQQQHIPIVLDPVMVATSGAQLLPQAAIKGLLEKLLPLTTILTPNIPEAKLLLQESGKSPKDVTGMDDLVDLAQAVQSLGPKYVLVKGGHLPLKGADTRDERIVANVLYGEGETFVFESSYLNPTNTHGTGCSLAYINFSSGYFLEYLLDRDDVKGPWKEYTEHEFVKQMGLGTLPVKAFRFYMIQDYLYLVHFSRANALAAYKAKTLDDISMSASVVTHIREEMNLHLAYCRKFGLSKEDIENHEESQACTAYTRYFLDIGQSEDWLALQIALLPCLLGYGMIGQRLRSDPTTVKEGNQYFEWIENYVADDFTEAVRVGSGRRYLNFLCGNE
ncbi:MAG: hypothetical protein Q9165_002968 [Trypethelium subeluteriae]